MSSQNLEDQERAIDIEWQQRSADLLMVLLGYPVADVVEEDDG